MTNRRVFGGFLVALGLTIVIIAISLQVTSADAQCGAQASSCRNCHEVNQEYSVSDSGEWHVSHAFGDFCQFCHGGNVQATDKNAAHTGMIYPLENPVSSCASCHPRDYRDLAVTYGDILGVEVGTATAIGGGASANDLERMQATIAAPPPLGGEDIKLVDYNRRYERDVLGEKDPPELGNPILAVLVVVFGSAGGALVWRFEHVGQRIRELSRSPFFVGDPEPIQYPPDYIPGIDGPARGPDEK
jgi:hypothetical protein